LPQINPFIDDLVYLIALALSAGDAFLPSAVEYDDLFYKLVEAGDVLVKFRDSCKFRLLRPRARWGRGREMMD
jgi:hypothetical protein